MRRWLPGLIGAVLVVATMSAQQPPPAAPAAPAPSAAPAPAAPPAPTAAPAAAAMPSEAAGYAWDKACAACHKEIHDSWAATKHAKTWGRLSGDERQKECAGCHLTGVTTALEHNVNANVQCEACHGAGKAHVDAATAGTAVPAGLKKSPGEAVCTPCHNDKSPHFRGFYFAALKSLVHKK